MSILEKFASGGINPAEFGRKRNMESDAAANALLQAEEKLLTALNANEKELYEEFTTAQMSLSANSVFCNKFALDN